MLQKLNKRVVVEKRVRKPVFNMRPKSIQREFTEGSLRQIILDKLKQGATFEELNNIVLNFKTNRKRLDSKKLDHKRTYGIIRIIHSVGGWGLRQSDKIYAYGPEEDND